MGFQPSLDRDSHLTPGGYLRGPNVYMAGSCLLASFDSLTAKEVLSAWLITKNITIEEAIEGMHLLGLDVVDCTKEGVYNIVKDLTSLAEQ